jgi:hypothetical protein
MYDEMVYSRLTNMKPARQYAQRHALRLGLRGYSWRLTYNTPQGKSAFNVFRESVLVSRSFL